MPTDRFTAAGAMAAGLWLRPRPCQSDARSRLWLRLTQRKRRAHPAAAGCAALWLWRLAVAAGSQSSISSGARRQTRSPPPSVARQADWISPSSRQRDS